MMLPQECVVRNRSVIRCIVIVRWDCCDCASPNAWCHEMHEGCDDSTCEYVNYVGCDPDCVDRTVLEGGDDYPVGTLSSEPLYVSLII